MNVIIEQQSPPNPSWEVINVDLPENATVEDAQAIVDDLNIYWATPDGERMLVWASKITNKDVTAPNFRILVDGEVVA